MSEENEDIAEEESNWPFIKQEVLDTSERDRKEG